MLKGVFLEAASCSDKRYGALTTLYNGIGEYQSAGEYFNKASYKEYFGDMFAGDFGHCTKKGNRLLAENIANVILKEVFGK